MAGILVYAAEGRADEVRAAIALMHGALVHACDAGRIVATLEGPRYTEIADALHAIQRMPGVVSAVLVSEHSEPIEALDEEISHDR